LAYLVLHRQAPQSRQHIAFLFWPDSSEAHARANLRQRLHYLHQALPEADHFLHFTAKSAQWRPEASFTLDVAEFERQLALAGEAAQRGRLAERQATLAAAAELYQGDLLPSCYDDWLLPERERLQEKFIQALEQLVLLCEEQGAYPAAIEYAQRLLRHDPLHESTYRHLMRLHALNGERASALRVYHICTTILERELGVTPNYDTQVVYERLLNLNTPPVLRPVSQLARTRGTRMVGRQAEWRLLCARGRRSRHRQNPPGRGDAHLGQPTRNKRRLYTCVCSGRGAGLCTGDRVAAHGYAAESVGAPGSCLANGDCASVNPVCTVLNH
jgi:DNA-binding SARP family transcriptional activator